MAAGVIASVMGWTSLGIAQKPVRIPKAPGITEAQAKQYLQQRTMIQACGGDTYTFQNVAIGHIDQRTIQGRRFTLYPIHARYFVTCKYGDEPMRAEVDLRTEAYRNDFGEITMIDPGFGENQDWNTSENEVRCRVQNTSPAKPGSGTAADLTESPWFGCFVMARNPD